MYTLEQIKKKLEDRKLSVVAEQTGLSRVTLHRVMKPETKTVNSRTLEALSLYFESGA